MMGSTMDIDGIIYELLRDRPYGSSTRLGVDEATIGQLIRVAKSKFMEQSVLLQLSAPITICGDIHGQFSDLTRLFETDGFPPTTNYLFLGDYVDRGNHSVECVLLLFCYKVKFPGNFFLLRGNHECSSINQIYGFYKECTRRYSQTLWKEFCACFDCLPLAAVVEDKIFCTHGGLSPSLKDVNQISQIKRPTDVPDSGLLCDLLWADPEPGVLSWGRNDRGVSVTFGVPQIEEFLTANGMDLICRAHQVVMKGYEFFGRRQLVTLFSAPNYCGEYGNSGATMSIDESLMCSFQILRPLPRQQTPSAQLWGENRPGTPPRPMMGGNMGGYRSGGY